MNDSLWCESHSDAGTNKQLSIEEIYDAICKRIRERYTEDSEQLTDKKAREAADNLLGLCNKIVEIETKE